MIYFLKFSTYIDKKEEVERMGSGGGRNRGADISAPKSFQKDNNNNKWLFLSLLNVSAIKKKIKGTILFVEGGENENI